MLFPTDAKQVQGICMLMREYEVQPLVIGNGTNLLVSDGQLSFAAVKTHDGLGKLELSGDTEVTAGSGVLLSRLAAFAQEHGLTGLEFAHGIPGTLGGAVTMNAGAYGGEMRGVVRKTLFLDNDLEMAEIVEDQHEFSYRHSRFSDREDIIVESVISLRRADPREIRFTMDELAARRRASQPLSFPSAGSTFKRPKKGYAAAMIEQAGLKGYAVGGAQVSEKHAGFVVNRGGATFDDVRRVMEHVQETVLREFGVLLEPEVKIIV
jgi:UDP-N-acetylmuramate dehydrogenase